MNEPFPFWHDAGGPGLQPGGFRLRSKVAIRTMYTPPVSCKTGLPSLKEARALVRAARGFRVGPGVVHPILTTSHKAGDALLRRPARRIGRIDDSVRRLLDGLAATMLGQPEGYACVGLAAPQLGIPLRAVVVRHPADGRVLKLVNPEVVPPRRGSRREARLGYEQSVEGCMSLPGQSVPVLRWAPVRVRARDERGVPVRFTATGDLARIVAHEVDHLNGRLITDHAAPYSTSGKAAAA